MRVKDVVSRSTNAAFYSDVQLGSYRRPENLELARSYIFIGKTTGSRKASLDLLRQVCNAYLPGNQPNRFTFIATYGHGKSHFALATANFFGRPGESAEVGAILENIRHACSDDALYASFCDFKHHHRPFLVVILRGDDSADLQSQFYRALDEALQDNEATRNTQLPFWFSTAERLLNNIRPESIPVAEAYLSSRQLDLALLREQVRRRETAARIVCRELHEHLHGVRPDLGSATSLREAVEWLADELCGPDGPLGGVLVLFDEFSAFVRDYAVSSKSVVGTPLQDLLNGIANRPEKAAFVAFAQHDPDTVAKTVLRTAPEHLASLQRELSRLPVPQRMVLYSSLEQVLDAYLKQNESNWEVLLADPGFGQAVFEATDATLQAFDGRYREELNWSRQRFQELVAMGCYPLSPMTMALLASVDLQSTSSPRSILGFVTKALNERGEQPALIDGRPNWIAPYGLVEYFGDMLGEDPWRDYTDALRQAGGPDTSPSERRALQALLLQVTAEVPTRTVGFERLIANLADLTVNDASTALRNLRQRGVIRCDDVQRIYTFWPAGRTASALEKEVAKRTARTSLTQALLDGLEPFFRQNDLLAPLPVSVSWGHPEDWQAEQLLVTRSAFERGQLKQLVEQRLLTTPDKRERSKGVVLWPVAVTMDDVEWFRKEVPKALDRELGTGVTAVAGMIPREPSPQLAELLLRRAALRSMSNAEIIAVGREQFDDLATRELGLLKSELGRLEGKCGSEVVQAARGRIGAVKPASLNALVSELYGMAYSGVPRPFFVQYRSTQTKLATSVTAVYVHLLDDSVGTPGLFDANKVAQDLVELFLVDAWGLLERGNRRIRPPAARTSAAAAWEAFDKAISPRTAARALADVVISLMNSPFGLDANALALIFSAWCGYHRHDLSFSESGRVTSIQEIARDVRKGVKAPRDFLASLLTVAVSRRDKSQIAEEVAALVQRTKTGSFSATEAQEAITSLQQFVADDRNQPRDRDAAKAAAERLTAALEVANDYDVKVRKVLEVAAATDVVKAHCDLLVHIQKLPTTSIVVPRSPAIAEVRERVLKELSKTTEVRCREFEVLSDLTHYELRRQLLGAMQHTLAVSQLEGLAGRVIRAIANLEKAREALEQRAGDDAALRVLFALPTRGPLSALRAAAAQINGLQLVSGDARRQAAERLQRVNAEVSRLEALANEVGGRVETCPDSACLRKLRESVIREQDLYRETPEAGLIATCLRRCEDLGEYFSRLEAIDRRSPSSPKDVLASVTALHDLKTEYQGQVGGRHLEMADAVADHLEELGRRQTAQALAWLAAREDEADASSPIQLMGKLASPPAFLPDDALRSLESLRSRVAKRIDEDQVLVVEQQFRRIVDVEQRRECLRRLEMLVTETEPVR